MYKNKLRQIKKHRQVMRAFRLRINMSQSAATYTQKVDESQSALVLAENFGSTK